MTRNDPNDPNWNGLVDARSDEELRKVFMRVAVFGDTEQEPAAATGSAPLLRRMVDVVDATTNDMPPAFLGSFVSEVFDATLAHLGQLGKQVGELDTPRAVADLMVALTVRAGDKVLDPACGNATALVAAARSHTDVSVSGFEINPRVARRASMRLLVNGIDSGTGFGVWPADAFAERGAGDYDVVLMQPPWGASFSAEQMSHVNDLVHDYSPANHRSGKTPGDLAWLLLALDALKSGGRAAVVLPDRSASPRHRGLHEDLLRLNAVEALIALPPGIFEHTAIPTVLWLLQLPETMSPSPVLMVDTQTMAEPLARGRARLGEAAMAEIFSIVDSHRAGHGIAAPPYVARTLGASELEPGRGLHPTTYLHEPPSDAVSHPSPETTMLSEIALTRFKGFDAETRFPLAPITLLYGANSAGKSSIIQALLLLQQSLQENRLVTQGRNLNVGAFDGILHAHEGEGLALSFTYGVLPSWIPEGGTPDPTLPRQVTWEFSRDSSGRGMPARSTYEFGPYALPLTLEEGRLDFALSLDEVLPTFEGVAEGTLLYPHDSRHMTGGTEVEQAGRLRGRIGNARRALRNLTDSGMEAITIRRSGLLPTGEVLQLRPTGPQRDSGIASSYANRTGRLLGGIGDEVTALLESLVWLGPLRSAPQRVYDRAESTSTPGDGKHVAMYLFDNASVVEQVNDWLARLEVPYALDMIPVTTGAAASLVGDLVAIELTDRRTGVAVTPADVGFGVSQVLPIVVELLSRRESVVAIEQPETHLHPRLQAHLADLFIDAAQAGGRRNQLLIETHSEHLMLRIQRRIREGSLAADQIAVLYVDRAPDGQAKVTRLRLDEQGEFLDEWPQEFFDDRLDEMFGSL